MSHVIALLFFFVIALPVEAGGTTATPTDRIIRQFSEVSARVEQVAEALCRERTEGMMCDLTIVLDTRPGATPNALQTYDRRGRPEIRVTRSLVAKLGSPDELAFVIGHEAGHHLAAHMARLKGASGLSRIRYAVFPGLSATGAEPGTAEQLWAFEREADAFGAMIAARAGYDPRACARALDHLPRQATATHPSAQDRERFLTRIAAKLH